MKLPESSLQNIGSTDKFPLISAWSDMQPTQSPVSLPYRSQQVSVGLAIPSSQTTAAPPEVLVIIVPTSDGKEFPKQLMAALPGLEFPTIVQLFSVDEGEL